jgi:lysophospholipase L1-like esterase
MYVGECVIMPAELSLKTGQTILFIGDSITAAGRLESAHKPFGRGYVHFVANFLLAKYPALDISIVNRGMSGDTIRGLQDRWDRDCLRCQPDTLTVLIGINDLYWHFAAPDQIGRAVHIEEYELTFRQLLSQTREQCNCRLILMEPFMFCKDRENQMFQPLGGYVEVVRKLAADFDAILVPLQERIDALIEHVPPQKWSEDSVHPYVWAHCWIAQRWLEAAGV